MIHKLFVLSGTVFIMLYIVINPDICITGASQGLLLWFHKVLPSLLPFIILTNILSRLDILSKINKYATPLTKILFDLPGDSLFAFITGFVSGYPMGAKTAALLLENGNLNRNEAQKVLCFCNNCGPLFIIGVVSTGMLGDTHLGYFMLFIQILSALILGILLRAYTHPSEDKTHYYSSVTKRNKHYSFSKIFNESVQNGMDTIVYIGGYIIFFSVLTHIFKNILPADLFTNNHLISKSESPIILGIITSVLEISNGIYTMSTAPLSQTLLASISFAIGFGGLCTYFQTAYILAHSGLSLSTYLCCKFLQGILCFINTLIFYPIYYNHRLNAQLTMNYEWILCLIVFLIFSLIMIKFLALLSCDDSIKFVKQKRQKQKN